MHVPSLVFWVYTCFLAVFIKIFHVIWLPFGDARVFNVTLIRFRSFKLCMVQLGPIIFSSFNAFASSHEINFISIVVIYHASSTLVGWIYFQCFCTQGALRLLNLQEASVTVSTAQVFYFENIMKYIHSNIF